MKKISLLKLKEGHKARIVEIAGGDALHHRFMTMGLYKDKEITKVGHFALRGPVTVKSGRSVIALGHGMAGKIFVEIDD